MSQRVNATVGDENRNLLGQRGINLQLFAEGDGAGDGDKGDKGDGKDKGEEYKAPASKEELDKLLQSETDKRVAQALKTQEDKLQKELDKKLKEAVKKAEEMSKLSVEEKEKAILAEQKIAQEAKDRELTVKQLKLDTIDSLTAQNLPLQFRDFVIGNSQTADEVNANIKNFKTLWDSELAKAVNVKLAEAGKPGGGGNGGGSSTSIGSQLAEQAKKSMENQKKNPYFG